MNLAELRKYPSVMVYKDAKPKDRIMQEHFRAYYCVQKVRELLMSQHPPDHKFLLEVIDDIMDASVTERFV